MKRHTQFRSTSVKYAQNTVQQSKTRSSTITLRLCTTDKTLLSHIITKYTHWPSHTINVIGTTVSVLQITTRQ